jgi:hypothetical protein
MVTQWLEPIATMTNVAARNRRNLMMYQRDPTLIPINKDAAFSFFSFLVAHEAMEGEPLCES